MNAYELAGYLEKQYIHSQGVADAISMLRQQADRITMLEQESRALRKQLIAACNELMEIKR